MNCSVFEIRNIPSWSNLCSENVTQERLYCQQKTTTTMVTTTTTTTNNNNNDNNYKFDNNNDNKDNDINKGNDNNNHNNNINNNNNNDNNNEIMLDSLIFTPISYNKYTNISEVRHFDLNSNSNVERFRCSKLKKYKHFYLFYSINSVFHDLL